MMRKLIIMFFILGVFTVISSCQDEAIVYTDDQPFVLEMKGETLKILQITDLHLTYGYDYRDQKTLKLIEALVKHDNYDLIVISGDLTMSPSAPRLFQQIIRHMERLETPWTFIFGNHENDYHTYEDFLSIIPETDYLYFKVGPQLLDGGVGNFHFTFTKDDHPFYRVYLLDSKAEAKASEDADFEYDYISEGQVEWYRQLVENDLVDSIVFMHIPLVQFNLWTNIVGTFGEDRVYAQGQDTGFFDAMVTYGRSKALFVGHDHLNDFYFILDNIMLAYGRATGYNGYGTLEKGGRHIEILENGQLSTYLVSESEVLS